MKSLKQIVNELITLASELEAHDINLRSLLGSDNTANPTNQGGEKVQRTIPKDQELQPLKIKKAPLSKDQRDQIRLLYNQGTPKKVLVETYQSSIQQVNAILHNNITKALASRLQMKH